MKKKGQITNLEKILFWVILILAVVYLIWLAVRFLR